MRIVFAVLSLLAIVPTALAEVAHPGGFPLPVSSVGDHVANLYTLIFWITVVIALLVTTLLSVAIFRFRASKRKEAAKFSHSTVLEIVWTIIPALICLLIAWKSYEGITYMRNMPEQGMTVDVIAYQFGWDFDYPDLEISAPEATEPHAELSKAGVDRYVKNLVVPVNTVVKLNVTARDVIHAFYAAQVGVKVDAIPGRINYVWFDADEVGNYIGQCAELCGAAHGEMFFNIRVLPKDEFVAWVNERRSANGLAALSAAQIEESFL